MEKYKKLPIFLFFLIALNGCSGNGTISTIEQPVFIYNSTEFPITNIQYSTCEEDEWLHPPNLPPQWSIKTGYAFELRIPELGCREIRFIASETLIASGKIDLAAEKINTWEIYQKTSTPKELNIRKAPSIFSCLNNNDYQCISSLKEEFGLDVTPEFFSQNRHNIIKIKRTKGYTEALSWIIKNGAIPFLNPSLVNQALYNATEITAPALLKAGYNVNAKDANGSTPIHNAASKNNPQLVIQLAEAGADINAKDTNLGESPLHKAAKNNDPITSKILIDFGADLDLKNNVGLTALHIATYRGSTELVDLYISKNAKFNTTNENGDTPLHTALLNNNQEIQALLSGAGADWNITNKFGETPKSILSSNILALEKEVQKEEESFALQKKQQQARQKVADAQELKDKQEKQRALGLLGGFVLGAAAVNAGASTEAGIQLMEVTSGAVDAAVLGTPEAAQAVNAKLETMRAQIERQKAFQNAALQSKQPIQQHNQSVIAAPAQVGACPRVTGPLFAGQSSGWYREVNNSDNPQGLGFYIGINDEPGELGAYKYTANVINIISVKGFSKRELNEKGICLPIKCVDCSFRYQSRFTTIGEHYPLDIRLHYDREAIFHVDVPANFPKEDWDLVGGSSAYGIQKFTDIRGGTIDRLLDKIRAIN